MKKLYEEFKDELEEEKESIGSELYFEPQYIAIDEDDGEVWVFETKPTLRLVTNSHLTYFESAHGAFKLGSGNFDDFEKVLEYIGAAS